MIPVLHDPARGYEFYLRVLLVSPPGALRTFQGLKRRFWYSLGCSASKDPQRKLLRYILGYWLPARARWSYLARSGLPAVSRKKNVPESHIINPLLTKLVRSRWLDIGLVLFFCEFMDSQKKELGQYPAILTSHLVNNPYI